jgi:hypothetical protein
MDLDLRQRLTREHQLAALAYRHREIYEHSRSHVSPEWWRHHYGQEPYSPLKRDRVRRYSSIFPKGSPVLGSVVRRRQPLGRCPRTAQFWLAKP